METITKTQRRRTSRKPGDSSVIRVEIKDGMGHPRWVTADLVDLTDGGFGLALRTPLKSGSTLVVRGKFGDHQGTDGLQATVRWCSESNGGAFLAGLEFVHQRSTFIRDDEPSTASTMDPEILDCYEVMQLSPNADPDTIARVYRILAQRYHPDNTATGNNEMFVQLSEAHQILSDPEKRARYDIQHRESRRLRWKIFDQAAVSTGTEGEKRKRTGILALLHAKMLRDPEQAEMNVQLIEELLGCPREHLQAALWYLKAKNYIRRGDNGRYSITIAGFEEAEAHQFAANRQITDAAHAS